MKTIFFNNTKVTPSDPNYAYCIFFGAGKANWNTNNLNDYRSVRPVAKNSAYIVSA